MSAETLVLQSSHVPMLSQPETVAEFIAKAAASVGQGVGEAAPGASGNSPTERPAKGSVRLL